MILINPCQFDAFITGHSIIIFYAQLFSLQLFVLLPAPNALCLVRPAGFRPITLQWALC
jgi:hypothetical protein